MKTIISFLMTILLWGAFPSSLLASTDCDGPAFPGAVGCQVTVDQGWDAKQQLDFWFTGQGSNIIPYSWFLNLELANSAKLFNNPDNINRYRYLPQDKSSSNPDGLPIGFTKDVARGNEKYRAISTEWLGVTCAACHTGQLEIGNRKVLIDGAPAMADFQSFFENMTTAMRATLNNPAKYKKFAENVTEYNWNSAWRTTDKEKLKQQLILVTESLEKRNALNSGGIRFGNARLDALGSILNQVLVAHGRPLMKEGTVNAPVSYPFIWDTPQHDRVQWNGSIVNAGLGAVSRNAGEVIGVFGTLKPNAIGEPVPDHQNSVNITHLRELEKLVWELKSPIWEDVWEGTDISKINSDLVNVGKGIYAKKCIRCHALPFNRDNRNSRISVTMVPIEEVMTDETTAMNFATRGEKIPFGISDGGMLSNSVAGVLVHEFLTNKPEVLKTIKEGQPKEIRDLVDQIAGMVLKDLDKDVPVTEKRQMILQFLGAMNKAGEKRAQNEWEKRNKNGTPRIDIDVAIECAENFLCYKARPLNGVWATGPFLHNGSVRTIRQLLDPSKRQKEFNVGSRKYDNKEMGFVDSGSFVMNTTLKGNFNTGHGNFNNYFANDDNFNALMEYLKTL